MLGVTVAIISLCASGLMALLFITERRVHQEEKKGLMEAVSQLYKQTVDIVTESGLQHNQIMTLQRYVETLETENTELSKRNMQERQQFESKIAEMKTKIKAIETENKNLQKKVEELQTMILNMQK